MPRIYVIEAVEPQRQFQTQTGVTVTQPIVVRELGNQGDYAHRLVVEMFTATDLQPHVGSMIAMEVRGRVTEKEGRHYNNLCARNYELL